VGRPYGLPRQPIDRQRASRTTAVGKRRPKARRALEITIMFEPTRLSGEYLVDAYSQTVPMRPRSIRPAEDAAGKPEVVRRSLATGGQGR
jgi:hypothetical protein